MIEPAAAPGYGELGGLAARFIAPPFSVLDARQGYWQERRRRWLGLGLRSELGRDGDLLNLERIASKKVFGVYEAPSARQLRPGGNWRSDGGLFGTNGQPEMRQKILGQFRRSYPAGPPADGLWGGPAPLESGPVSVGSSIFDPVLCELVYRWFAPPGGAVLDPFAGGSVRGIVAAMLGHPYTGIDLSAAQVEADRSQGDLILPPDAPRPRWINADAREIPDAIPAGEEFDLVFTCPPYFDLEIYSDDPRDLSNAPDFAEFLTSMELILHRAAARLRDGRFAVIVVSEIRDRQGYCRGLVPGTIEVAHAAGLRLYNEAVLINAGGTLSLRVGRYMEASRKLGRAHQNVLVFLKGLPPRGWSYDRPEPPSPQLALWPEAVA